MFDKYVIKNAIEETCSSMAFTISRIFGLFYSHSMVPGGFDVIS